MNEHARLEIPNRSRQPIVVVESMDDDDTRLEVPSSSLVVRVRLGDSDEHDARRPRPVRRCRGDEHDDSSCPGPRRHPSSSSSIEIVNDGECVGQSAPMNHRCCRPSRVRGGRLSGGLLTKVRSKSRTDAPGSLGVGKPLPGWIFLVSGGVGPRRLRRRRRSCCHPRCRRCRYRCRRQRATFIKKKYTPVCSLIGPCTRLTPLTACTVYQQVQVLRGQLWPSRANLRADDVARQELDHGDLNQQLPTGERRGRPMRVVMTINDDGRRI